MLSQAKQEIAKYINNKVTLFQSLKPNAETSQSIQKQGTFYYTMLECNFNLPSIGNSRFLYIYAPKKNFGVCSC